MTAEIEASFAAGIPGAQAGADLTLQVGRLASAIEQDRWARQQKAAHDLRFAPIVPLVAFNAGAAVGNVLLFNAETWGPKTGYFWAVQSLIAGGLTGTDTVTVYRGLGATAVTPASQKSQPLTAAAPLYNPGRTDLILQPGDFLTVAGTGLASTQVAVQMDVIIGTLDQLHDFLM